LVAHVDADRQEIQQAIGKVEDALVEQGMQLLRSASVYGMAFQQYYLPLRRHGRTWRQLIDGKLGNSHRISLAAVNLSDDN